MVGLGAVAGLPVELVWGREGRIVRPGKGVLKGVAVEVAVAVVAVVAAVAAAAAAAVDMAVAWVGVVGREARAGSTFLEMKRSGLVGFVAEVGGVVEGRPGD